MGRASTAKNKGGAATHTSLGRKPTAPLRRYKPRTERGLPLTTPEVRELKSNHTQLIISPKVEVGEEFKTAAPSVGEEENAGATELHKARVRKRWGTEEPGS